VQGFPSAVWSWLQYGGLANLLETHLEQDHMELSSLPHQEKIAIEQRKQKPELTTQHTLQKQRQAISSLLNDVVLTCG